MKIYISPSSQTANEYAWGNVSEEEICNRIGAVVAKALAKNGYEVKLAKRGMTYQQRVAESNAYGADIHVCIHTNAGGGDGTVMFAHPSSVNNKYVQNVYKMVAAISPGKDDGVRAMTNLYEINQTKATCVYVECEFHDNAKLAKWIVENVEALGEAIAKGFCAADNVTYLGLNCESNESNESNESDESNEVRYKIQVGAFSKKENAEKFLAELKKKGYADAFIVQV